jgi:hypothetical protein
MNKIPRYRQSIIKASHYGPTNPPLHCLARVVAVMEAEGKFLGKWKSGRTWKSLGSKYVSGYTRLTCRLSLNVQSRGAGLKSWQQKVEERQIQQLEKLQKKEALDAKAAKVEVPYIALSSNSMLDYAQKKGG